MNRGFTLAEVLITIGIIGMVAAMTLPMITTKYQKQVTAIKLKKMFINFEQAIKLTESKESTLRNEWTFNTVQEKDNFIKSKIIPNLNCYKVLDKLGNSNTARRAPICIFRDGTMLAFHIKDATSTTAIELFFIINTNSLYNEKIVYGKDAFYYALPLNTKNDKLTRTRNIYLNACNPGTSDSNARSCLNLIRYDDWQIKSDYPW